MRSPEVSKPEVVYENPYQKILRITATSPQFEKVFYVNALARRVGLVIVRGEEILLVRQWRLLINGFALEIPGGRIDSTESPEEAAVREGIEETCLRCENLQSLVYFHPGLDTFDNPTFLFLATEFSVLSNREFHPGEVTERIWIPVSRCLQMIFAGEIVDSMTILAILAYHTRHTSTPDTFAHA